MFNIRNRIKVFIVISFLTLGSGCALTQERVKLSYAPQFSVPKVERADASIVKVEVVDSRTTNKVSAKKNPHGIDVASLVKGAIEVELEHRGFQLGTGKTLVSVELTKFYNDFKVGLFSGDAVAELFMVVQVKDSTNILYSRSITGEGLNKGIQLASGSNAKIALDAALKDAVSKLFQDTKFLESIVKAGTET
jgi:uncharacterized lipoprotein YajG